MADVIKSKMQRHNNQFSTINIRHHQSAIDNVSGGGMNCVSCDICVYHLGLFVFFPLGFPQLQSDWSLSFDHGLDYAS